MKNFKQSTLESTLLQDIKHLQTDSPPFMSSMFKAELVLVCVFLKKPFFSFIKIILVHSNTLVTI